MPGVSHAIINVCDPRGDVTVAYTKIHTRGANSSDITKLARELYSVLSQDVRFSQHGVFVLITEHSDRDLPMQTTITAKNSPRWQDHSLHEYVTASLREKNIWMRFNAY